MGMYPWGSLRDLDLFRTKVGWQWTWIRFAILHAMQPKLIVDVLGVAQMVREGLGIKMDFDT